ncbi:type II toxin-antitoxin system ParD family antitoxin [Neorhizobium sp. JUb45]|uniref:ribbon-helix-helix domain-containing protein n=1 Tax=unclassified Neorhizobium TaxID=2629175 RepID=UPI00104DE8AC|nr:type II toxin-antitoxin system ParD family antitoxin [Neorhizobium sp. JUb45]TCR04644.1 antitoxin ParD1/3/4 [Neorhizobium sp. JUb45]
MSVRKLSIELPEVMIEAIEHRIDAGRYQSTSDVMRAAIDALLREEEAQDTQLDAVREQVRASLDDPRPNLSSAEMHKHIENLYAGHRG